MPLGAAISFVIAAGLILAVAIYWVARDARGLTQDAPIVFSERRYFAELVPVLLAQAFVSALMQSDIQILGHHLVPPPGAVNGQVVAKEWVGVYRACQLFAFLPYQLLFSVTQMADDLDD